MTKAAFSHPGNTSSSLSSSAKPFRANAAELPPPLRAAESEEVRKRAATFPRALPDSTHLVGFPSGGYGATHRREFGLLGLQPQKDRPQLRWEKSEGSREFDPSTGKGAAQSHPAAVDQVDDGRDGLGVIICHFIDARDEFAQGTLRHSGHSVCLLLPRDAAKERPRW